MRRHGCCTLDSDFSLRMEVGSQVPFKSEGAVFEILLQSRHVALPRIGGVANDVFLRLQLCRVRSINQEPVSIAYVSTQPVFFGITQDTNVRQIQNLSPES